MARTQSSRPPVRDRILAAASRLFYQEGIQNVGVDRIISESGVAKMSLYNHFKSKDALIAAWLKQRDEEWCTWFHARMDALSTGIDVEGSQLIAAQRRLLIIFDVLYEWFEQPNFRGCAFINSTVELA
ncbi:MAG: helix-turn-helix transcriptional regulator, partial [Symploca sp. SIO2B6]|nr:helix-turn-helix transcriptional regulator [Symploca sp. SIO2B6]